MPRKPRPITGVVIESQPLKIVSQRKRYAGEAEPGASFEVGAVVDFEADGNRARAVRARSFAGEIEFSGLRDWAPGRWGIVTELPSRPDASVTIVDGLSGALVGRERDDGLKVGDLVRYDLMSDFMALDLERIRPKSS